MSRNCPSHTKECPANLKKKMHENGVCSSTTDRDVYRQHTPRMAQPRLCYLSKHSANFPSLHSEETSTAEIKQLVAQVCEKLVRIAREYGHDARLVCDLSHNNLTVEHFNLITQLLLESSVHLFALDLSWNRIFVSTWNTFLPTVRQLLTRATHIDLVGNYLPPLQSDNAGLL